MIKKIFLSLLLLFFFGVTNVQAATSSIMLNSDDGQVLYEQNADELRYPASLTKLMTLYITFHALESGRLKLTDKLKVSKTAAGRSPSKLGVRAGSTITVKDAVMAVIVKSANDCATVLAEHFAKTEAEFAVMMTDTARKLGMKNTTFKNASGLPNSAQKSTARDMATLAMAVYHHFPQYYKWFSAQSFKYQGRTITGHNHLLQTFAGADGMKTGYTAASGYNIVTYAHRHNKRVIAVTMGHKYWNERDKKAALMMDKGLHALKNADKIDIAALSTAINGTANSKMANLKTAKNPPLPTARKTTNSTSETSKIATVGGHSETPRITVTANGHYAVQVGSFSDYKRAKNYAASVKNNLAKKFAVHNIAVEKVEAANGTMYRSKVVGLAKSDATKICANMKRQKKSCFVTVDNSNSMKLAQK